jgi:hypothetical protein
MICMEGGDSIEDATALGSGLSCEFVTCSKI